VYVGIVVMLLIQKRIWNISLKERNAYTVERDCVKHVPIFAISNKTKSGIRETRTITVIGSVEARGVPTSRKMVVALRGGIQLRTVVGVLGAMWSWRRFLGDCLSVVRLFTISMGMFSMTALRTFS